LTPRAATIERPAAGAAVEDDDTSPAQRHLSQRSRMTLPRRVPWGAVHLVSLGAAAAVLLVANRNQWFFADEWAFITDRGPGFADLDLFRPHNDHWSTIPVLVYWGLLSTVGLTSYLPYVAVVVVLHLGLSHLLWRASIRAGARPAIATGLVAVFAVLGSGAENLLWAFQMGFVGAVAFGWAAVLLHDHDGRFSWRDLGGWVASIIALMFSGPALALVGVATVTVWLRRRRVVDTLLTAAAPALVFGAWWWSEGRHAGRVPSSSDDRWLVVDWAWTGLTDAIEAVVGIPQTGGLLVLALLFWWARHLDLASGRASLTFAGSIGAVAFFLLTATGRVSLGIESATASRYTYIAAALLLPAVAFVVTRAVPDGTAQTVFVLAVCALVGLHNLGELRTRTSEEMGREQSLGGVLVATARLLREGQPTAMNAPSPKDNPNLSAEDLRRIDDYGWLPEVDPTTTEELTAEAVLGIGFVPPADQLGVVSIGGSAVNITPAEPRDGVACVAVQPITRQAQIILGADAPLWRVRLQGPANRTIRVYLVRDGDASEPMEFTLPSSPVDLVSGARGTVAVTLPVTGATTVCGVAP
jgi:hypothetical protein